jgi:beta-galactosidase
MENNTYMRTYLFLLILVFFTPISLWAQTGRKTVLFNEDWKFHKGDIPKAETVEFDDTDWRKLSLPHDWSIEGPFSKEWASGTGYLPGGIGWYRKTFDFSGVNPEGRTFIYFDGVYKNSEVWINGKYLGKRPNGYIPFQYEIGPYLKKAGKNVISVKVDHSKFADSRWYPGSGIYRNVYLINT